MNRNIFKGKKNRKKNSFRLLAFCLCMIFLPVWGLTACQSSSSSDKEVSIYDLQKAMLEADESLPDMSTVNSSAEDAEDSFSYLSDMDYDKVDAYFLAYSSEGKADEIAVIRLKDSNDVSDAKASMEDHVQGRINLYKNYDPTQVSRAEGAVIFTEGNYVVLIISDNSDAVKQAFEGNI